MPEPKASADIPRGPTNEAATAHGRDGFERNATAVIAATRAASPKIQADAARARSPALEEWPIIDAKHAMAA